MLPDLGLVLLEAVDRRFLAGLELASGLRNCDIKAVHVSDDASHELRVAADWMSLGLTWARLEIEDAAGRPLLEAVKDVVLRETATRRRVVVIIPEVAVGRWWHLLLHQGTGRRIAHQLQALRGVSTVVVPFATS